MDTAGQSRRRFLTVVAAGGAAAVAGAVAGEPARALPPGDDPCNYRPRYEEVGPVTLGGIMITYVSAPLNARGTVWSTPGWPGATRRPASSCTPRTAWSRSPAGTGSGS
jgi:hypothetical protein